MGARHRQLKEHCRVNTDTMQFTLSPMFKSQDGIGEFGVHVPGPPWILGHRGAPREAPENTLASLRRAIDLGLDGVEYDVHSCATGDALLIHDTTLERTTNGHGLVSDLSLVEAANLDAGGWFQRRFSGEPLPLLEEALELSGNRAGSWPQHMIELKVPHLVHEVARQLKALGRPMSVRLASFNRAVCLEARDAGLVPMLLAVGPPAARPRPHPPGPRPGRPTTPGPRAGATPWTRCSSAMRLRPGPCCGRASRRANGLLIPCWLYAIPIRTSNWPIRPSVLPWTALKRTNAHTC